MDRTAVMRSALWATALWNLGGALSFTFPASLGQNIGLPLPVSPFYTGFIAFVIGAFAAIYAWLARRPEIDRPLVVVAAIGKSGFFAVALACWFLGEIPGRLVAVATVDLAFAAVFVWWLVGEPRGQSAAQPGAPADVARPAGERRG